MSVAPLRFSLPAIVFALILAAPRDASALRFTLGLEAGFTPLVVDPAPEAGGGNLRFGLRPVLEVETSRWFAIGAYTPFTLLRAGSGSTTGAESVFALGVSLRKPWLRAEAPEEILLYGTLRGGFGTADGRPGGFVGGAAGLAVTWLETGRGAFFELSAGHVGIPGGPIDRPFPEVDRWLIGLSMGVIFRLGGETWGLE